MGVPNRKSTMVNSPSRKLKLIFGVAAILICIMVIKSFQSGAGTSRLEVDVVRKLPLESIDKINTLKNEQKNSASDNPLVYENKINDIKNTLVNEQKSSDIKNVVNENKLSDIKNEEKTSEIKNTVVNEQKKNDINNTLIKEQKSTDTNNTFIYEHPKSINFTSDDTPFVPPKWDTNCIRKIPREYTDGKGDAAIIIPPVDVLKYMDDEVVICIFQRYVTSLQRHCAQPELIGLLNKIKRPGVGGWNVCLDQKYRPSDPCIVYSFSKNYTDFSFAASMADRFHCEVHKFYESHKETSDTNMVLTHDLWIDTSNRDNRKTLSAIMSALGHKDRVLDVLTMDTEGEEWAVLKELISSGTIKKIRQLSLVIYGPYENDNKQAYIERMIVLNSLYEQGFRIFLANRNWDAKFHSHPKRTSGHVLNLVQDSGVSVPPQHLVIPGDDVIAKMSPYYIGDFFHRYCMSAQIHCKELVRMGKMISGGWDICNDKEWRPQPPCLVYSFGINFDFSFDDEMSQFYGCEVHSFDPSMKTRDYKQAPRVYYHDSGIANTNDVPSEWRLRTLQTFKNELGHANRHLDILKMDVENWEWASVPEIIQSGTLKNVTQFLLEIHLDQIVNDTTTKYIDFLKYFRNIYNEGYRIFWSHRNPYCVFTAQDSNIERDGCYEIYFLNINKKKS